MSTTSPIRHVRTRGYPDAEVQRRATTRGFDKIFDQALLENNVELIEDAQLHDGGEVVRSLKAIDGGDVKSTRRPAAEEEFATDYVKAQGFAREGGCLLNVDNEGGERAVVPGCATAAPGGVSADELREFAPLIRAHPRVSDFDVTEIDVTREAPNEHTVRLATLVVLDNLAEYLRRPPMNRSGR